MVVNIPKSDLEERWVPPEVIQYQVEPYRSHAKRENDFLDRERSEIEDGLKLSNENASDEASNRLSSRDWKVQGSKKAITSMKLIFELILIY